jgi:hypothetical protein
VSSRQHAIELFKWVRKISTDMLNGFPKEKATFQPSPTDNHVVWVLGHLASTDGWIGSVLDIPGTSVPESYAKHFGPGSKPTSNPKDYPPFEDVLKTFNSTREALLRWYSSASDAQLATSLKEKSGGFTSDPIDAAYKLAWHEGWHFGQVASVRKALGLPSVMG